MRRLLVALILVGGCSSDGAIESVGGSQSATSTPGRQAAETIVPAPTESNGVDASAPPSSQTSPEPREALTLASLGAEYALFSAPHGSTAPLEMRNPPLAQPVTVGRVGNHAEAHVLRRGSSFLFAQTFDKKRHQGEQFLHPETTITDERGRILRTLDMAVQPQLVAPDRLFWIEYTEEERCNAYESPTCRPRRLLVEDALTGSGRTVLEGSNPFAIWPIPKGVVVSEIDGSVVVHTGTVRRVDIGGDQFLGASRRGELWTIGSPIRGVSTLNVRDLQGRVIRHLDSARDGIDATYAVESDWAVVFTWDSEPGDVHVDAWNGVRTVSIPLRGSHPRPPLLLPAGVAFLVMTDADDRTVQLEWCVIERASCEVVVDLPLISYFTFERRGT